LARREVNKLGAYHTTIISYPLREAQFEM